MFACAYQCLATRLNDSFGERMMIEGHSPVKLVELVLRTGGDAGKWPASCDRSSDRERSCHGQVPPDGTQPHDVEGSVSIHI